FLLRVTGMGERVPEVPSVRLLRPDVRGRRLGLPGTVRSFLGTRAEGRSDVLLDMAAQLHDRGAGTSVLAEMVQAASPDVTDRNDD
ncbi:hypothetical protein, partial [Actinoplanes sp. NBRC 103695]|uniref:hypothetical protein n=1 Tax=Actinoplanes sp. NBRC 103695 TaxID=3032202 RepID=UPI0025568361